MAQFDRCPECKSEMIAPMGSSWTCFSCGTNFGGNGLCGSLSALETEQDRTEALADLSIERADDAEDASYGVATSETPATVSSTPDSSSAPAVAAKSELRQPDGLVTVEDTIDRETDDEYRKVFNDTVMAIADMPFDTEVERSATLDKIQQRIHELDALIRKAKIQQQALRATKEHRLQFVSARTREQLAESDKAYKPRKRAESSEGKPKVARKPSKADNVTAAQLGLPDASAKVLKAASTLLGLGMSNDETLAKLREAKLIP